MGSLRARLSAIAAVVALVCALAPVAHRASVAHAAGNCTVDATPDSEERAFLVLINNYRAQDGLAPLTLSYGLTKASAWKSVDMAANAYFAHDDLTRTWVDRIRDCGYGYNTYLGENIAAGYNTAQAVFDAWRNSPAHNANMLGANYTTIGIGRYVLAGSPYGVYWTTDFGGVSDGMVWASEAPQPLVALAPPTATSRRPALASAAREKPRDIRPAHANPHPTPRRVFDRPLSVQGRGELLAPR